MTRFSLPLAALWLASLPTLACAQPIGPTVPQSSIATRTAGGLRLTTMKTLYDQSANVTAYKTAGTANSTALNTWASSGWRTDRYPLELPHRYPISATWDIGHRMGMRLMFTGGGWDDGRPESQYYAADYIAGTPSALVWANRDSVTGPVLRSKVGGGHVGDVVVQGLIGLSTRPALLATAEKAFRVDVGWEQTGNQSLGLGCGKVDFDSFSGVLCKTAFKVVPGAGDFANSNGDESQFRRFVARYCDTGFWSAQADALHWRFGKAVQLDTETMWLYDKAGRFICEDFSAQDAEADDTLTNNYPSTTGLKITAKDTVDGLAPPFWFGVATIDDATEATYKLIDVNPSEAGQYSSAVVEVCSLHGPTDRSTGVLCDFEDCHGKFIVHSGTGLWPGFIESTGSTTKAVTWECNITKCSFKTGSVITTVRQYFSANTRGRIAVFAMGNSEETGGSGEANDGGYYPNFCGVIDIDGAGASNFTILSGGYFTFQSTP